GSLQGAGVTVASGAALQVASNVTAAAALTVNGAGTFQVTAGTFDVNGQTVSIGAGFATGGSGTLTMQNPADDLTLSGPATFAGGNTGGLLTNGTLRFTGTVMSATGQAFDATASHTTVLGAASGSNYITWSSPVAGHGLRHLTFQNAGSHSLESNMYITGNVTFAASVSSIVTGSYHIYVGGNIIDNSSISGGAWQAGAVVHLAGTPTTLPGTLKVNTLQFEGGATVPLPGDLMANYVVVDGAGTNLKLNGHLLKGLTSVVSFTTQNGGTLEMSTGADSLDFRYMYFNGGSTAGLLTKGAIVFSSFEQGRNGPFSPVPGASPSAFAPSAGVRAHAGGVGIYFKDPGSGPGFSHFWHLQPDGAAPYLTTDVFVDSILVFENTGAGLQSDSAAQGRVRKVTTNGVLNSGTFGATLTGVSVLLNGSVANSTFFNSVTWTGFPAGYTGTLFEQNRATNGTTLNFHNFSAITVSGGGKFVSNTGAAGLTLGASNAGLSGTLSACTTGGLLGTGQGCP
ncbi:MAG: hypothetical protein U9Q74_07015, partial [Gemmatimonadota bacterium]|nr:hypothetical protein [Gemmatimonadota bacterium]